MLSTGPVRRRYFLVGDQCFEVATLKTSVCPSTSQRIIIEIRHFLGLHRPESLSVIRFDSDWTRINHRSLTSFLPAICWLTPV
jgi:hypothetical protein